MSTIAELEHRLGETERRLEAYGVAPDDRMGRLQRASLEHHAEELREQIFKAKLGRAVEVLDLRLKGEEFEGSIALDFLARVASHLSAAVYRASKYIHTGKPSGGIPSFIRETINLRMVELAHSSTRILITGNTAPDLFGRSLLEESLLNTFGILESETPETLMDRAAGLGAASVRELRGFLEAISREGAAVEIAWRSPSEVTYRWEGNEERIRQVAQTLSTLEALQPETISLEGEVITLSLKGKIEIRPDQGRPIQGSVPESLFETLRALHVGERVAAVFRKDVLHNRVTNAERVSYTLLKVAQS